MKLGRHAGHRLHASSLRPAAALLVAGAAAGPSALDPCGEMVQSEPIAGHPGREMTDKTGFWGPGATSYST